jgi:hypothetical protein
MVDFFTVGSYTLFGWKEDGGQGKNGRKRITIPLFDWKKNKASERKMKGMTLEPNNFLSSKIGRM